MFYQPFPSQLSVTANQKNLLDGSRGSVEAFESGLGQILYLEADALVPFAGGDPAGNDAFDIGAMVEDFLAELIQAQNPAMLLLDSAKLHLLSANT